MSVRIKPLLSIGLLLAASLALSACHVHGHLPPGQVKQILNVPPGQAKKL